MILPLIVMAGCQKPEVSVCEQFTKSQITAPDTYRRVKVLEVDSAPMTPAAFAQAAGLQKPATELEKLSRTLHDVEIKGHQLAMRSVSIEYDAANTYGVPVRSVAVCAFRLIDGKVDSDAELEQHLGAGRTRDALGTLATLKGTKPPAAPKYGCCV